MEVRLLIEEFRGESGDMTLDAYEILTRVERLLRDLVHKEDWTCLQRHMNPIAKTHTGVRDYPLPDDFGSNFIRSAATDGKKHLCKLSDGTNESFLDFKPHSEFFGADFEAASNGRPQAYTIVADNQGYKRIHLDPPPDANGSTHYTIRGVFSPSFANMSLDTWIPEEVSSYLLHGVLQKVQPENPSHRNEFLLSRQALYLEEARLRDSRIASQEGSLPGHDGYALEFQR